MLVSQLQDYLAAGWGGAAVAERTRAYPLQPFNPGYFAHRSGLRTWAEEWRAAHQPQEHRAATRPSQSIQPVERQGTVPAAWTLAQLAHFWRNPAQHWFERRLYVRYGELPEVAQDHEPLAVTGLARWGVWQALLESLHSLVDQGADLAQVRNMARLELQRLAHAGVLPLHASGEALQKQWLEALDFLLRQWVWAREHWPGVAEPLHLHYDHPVDPQLHLDDWLHGLRTEASSVERVLVHVSPGKWLQKTATANRPHSLRLHALIPAWVRSVVLAASGNQQGAGGAQPVRQCLIGIDAQLDIAPMAAEDARRQLEDMLLLAEKGGRHPLPLAVKTGFAWLQAVAQAGQKGAQESQAMQQACQSARQAYEGSMHQIAERQSNPYIARLFPDFSRLAAEPEFRPMMEAMLEPVLRWEAHAITVVDAVSQQK